MGITLTREQVLALAPDDSSAKAASGLLADNKWLRLGADEDALWGECQGSGSKPYQAQVDLSALVSRCSCPSRKFPCKHGLALMLLRAQGNPRFSPADRPAWVDEWLSSRREKAAKKEAAPARADNPKDDAELAKAAARRETTRWNRIEAGCNDLERWIADQFRRGFAQFGPEQRQDWSAMAARMVDAQAPGLTPHLQAALEAMDQGLAHYGEAIERLGLLQLLNEGVRRRAQLSPARCADVRAALGWPLDKDEVLSVGEAVADLWQVLGQTVEEIDSKLSERRVWLRGHASGRDALLQDFAYGGRGWDAWQTGAHYKATMRYFPGSVPLRAIAVDAVAAQSPAPSSPADVDTALDQLSRCYAANPWLAHLPLVLAPAILTGDRHGWFVSTAAGSLPLRIDEDAVWSLHAFAGGAELTLMGEWNGRSLHLLSAWDAAQGLWTAEASS
jgi:hypothetical protein